MNAHETTRHRSVLLEECCEYLRPSNSEGELLLLDCTLGGGGHSEALMKRYPNYFLFGMDKDPNAVLRAQARLSSFASRMLLFPGDFGDFPRHVTEAAHASGRDDIRFSGILVDLGISSDQLDDPARGFSFMTDSPLDMRMNPEQSLTADALVNDTSPQDLRRIFSVGGVGASSDALAREIVANRPVKTTAELGEICRTVMLRAKRKQKNRDMGRTAHPATVPFQALRIAVNSELEVLKRFLANVLDYLAPGGRLAVISFHSLEDTHVTRAMRSWSRPPTALRKLPGAENAVFGRLLTPKAVLPSAAEVESNSRARSARLRVFESSNGG